MSDATYSPGEQFLRLTISLLLSDGSRSISVHPFRDEEGTYGDFIDFLEQNIDHEAIPDPEAICCGTIKLDPSQHGEHKLRVIMYQDGVDLRLR